MMELGVSRTIQSGVNKNYYPSDNNFEAVKVYSLYFYQDSGFGRYQYDVQLTNHKGLLSKILFTMDHNQRTGDIQFVRTVYSLQRLNIDESKAPYTDMDLDEVREDELMQTILNFGANQVANKVIEKEGLAASKYIVIRIGSVRRQVLNDGKRYRFDVTLENNENIKITTVFVVFCQDFTEKLTFITYSYSIKYDPNLTPPARLPTGTQIPTGYSAVDPSNVKSSSEVKVVYNYGYQEILAIINKQGRLKGAPSTYEVSEVYTIFRKISTGIYYKFDMMITNNGGVTILTNFTVFYKPGTGEFKIDSYSYNVNNQVVPNLGIYMPLKKSFIESDSLVQSLLQYGVQAILFRGYAINYLPFSTYQVSEIIEVQRQAFYEYQNYKFDIKMKNTLGGTVNAKFTIVYKIYNKEMKLNGYSYGYVKPVA